MQVLVFNAGSSSLKFDVVEMEARAPSPSAGHKLVSAIIEGIGSDQVMLSLLDGKDTASKQPFKAESYGAAAKGALDWLRKEHKEEGAFDILGHRVVHGADRFDGPAPIDDHVVSAIRELDKLAPLHNEAAAEVIDAVRDVMGRKQRMTAVFDTSFHRTLPAAAFTYALPFDIAAKHRIRRYGFHGVSHRYLSMRFCELTGRAAENVRVVTTHLESGASICAVRGGKPVETSMGFTPLEGLVMGKRCGDLDPAIVTFLMREEGLSIDDVDDLLNKKSGLLGLSGVSHDTRELEKHAATDEHARLALDVFCHRLRKYIGAYVAVLNGADALVFGGGIGEDSPAIREQVCRDLDWLGIEIDGAANEALINREGCVSKEGSRLPVWVIPTEEALTVAWEAVIQSQ